MFITKTNIRAGKVINLFIFRFPQSDVRMMTLASEAELMDDKVKQLGTLTTKENVEQLVPEVSGDLVFLDDMSLLGGVANSLKNQGFVLTSTDCSTEVLAPEGLAVIAKKQFGEQSYILFRKVCMSLKQSTLQFSL